MVQDRLREGDVEAPPISLRFRLSICVILIALLIEAAFAGLFPLAARFFIDRALIPEDRDALYLMLIVLASAAAISLSAGLLRDFLSARIQSRALSGLRQSMFERLQRVS